MERDYTYAELCRMTKKRVIRLAGYKNIKAALKDKINVVMGGRDERLTKKFMAKIIASDK